MSCGRLFASPCMFRSGGTNGRRHVEEEAQIGGYVDGEVLLPQLTLANSVSELEKA